MGTRFGEGELWSGWRRVWTKVAASLVSVRGGGGGVDAGTLGRDAETLTLGAWSMRCQTHARVAVGRGRGWGGADEGGGEGEGKGCTEAERPAASVLVLVAWVGLGLSTCYKQAHEQRPAMQSRSRVDVLDT
eukprot:scaffold5053_cov68-Isochrysis_galbana.AAC.1